MREIKFRVYNKKDKIWVASWLIGQSGVQSETPDKVFMQYTGLKDNNGVEIYEGDIVSAVAEEDYLENSIISDIIWNKKNYQWQVRAGQEYPHGLDIGWGGWDCIEVIGNIYENPDLLDKQ